VRWVGLVVNSDGGGAHGERSDIVVVALEEVLAVLFGDADVVGGVLGLRADAANAGCVVHCLHASSARSHTASLWYELLT
jgi:hypothetical protein